MHRIFTYPILVAGVLGAARCSAPPRVYVDSEIGRLGSDRIALLPLDNLSGVDGASQRMDEVLFVELLGLGSFEVVDPGQVDQAILELRIRRTSMLTREEAESLSRKLSVRALIAGSLLEYGMKAPRAGSGSVVPSISISLRMIDAGSGSVLWAVTHTRSGDDAEKVFGLGKISSETQLAKVLANEVFDSLRRVKWRSQ